MPIVLPSDATGTPKKLRIGPVVRFVDVGIITPEQSIALDRSVFEARDSDLVPDTIHIYSRDRRTVSLGRSGDPSVDLFPDIPGDLSIVRRMSGGGTILTGPDQIIIVVTLGGEIPDRNVSFELICKCISDVLAHFGILSEFKPPNDILVDGKKISGGAQYRKPHSFIHQATLIVRNDPLAEKIIVPKPGRIYNGLTSIEEQTGRVPERTEIVDALIEAFSGILDVEIKKGTLTGSEADAAGIRV
ncbi:MAG: lipoate--protein ligase family protein [Candidatus Methanoplasma sp.]|jgi:lipoate-protein ligase A|nr:lipoate--protein ligase family protein [Candidatus Methanoplasma sp.]